MQVQSKLVTLTLEKIPFSTSASCDELLAAGQKVEGLLIDSWCTQWCLSLKGKAKYGINKLDLDSGKLDKNI